VFRKETMTGRVPYSDLTKLSLHNNKRTVQQTFGMIEQKTTKMSAVGCDMKFFGSCASE